MSQIVKNALSRNAQESFRKNSWIRSQMPIDDFQNLSSSSLSKRKSLVKMFVKIRSVVFTRSR